MKRLLDFAAAMFFLGMAVFVVCAGFALIGWAF